RELLEETDGVPDTLQGFAWCRENLAADSTSVACVDGDEIRESAANVDSDCPAHVSPGVSFCHSQPRPNANLCIRTAGRARPPLPGARPEVRNHRHRGTRGPLFALRAEATGPANSRSGGH